MSFLFKKSQKVYVVGTGRSGTQTIAEINNGVHEPEPSIVVDATAFFMGNISNLSSLKEKLITRDKLDTPLISDNKQSLVIPLIRELNPRAKFILLVREPVSCIESFYARGAYSESELSEPKPSIFALNRPKPVGDFPKDWSQYMKCAWYWVTINLTCIRELQGSNYQIIFTSELPKNEVFNDSNEKQKASMNDKKQFGLSDSETKMVNDYVLPAWKEINKFRKILT